MAQERLLAVAPREVGAEDVTDILRSCFQAVGG
jgi:hypothetical protein